MVERLVRAGQELLVAQVDVVDSFRGKEVFPEPPKALLEFIEKTSEQGFTFEPYLEPTLDFSRDVQYPGLKQGPNPYLYELIKRGLLPTDVVRLSGPVWAAMEGLQKPEYDGGKQLYKNDPLASILEDLRQKGGKQGIEVPDYCKHIPPISRYGVSALEIERHIHRLFAQDAKVEERNVGNSYAAFLYRGNTAHPEWGETTTWEWFPKDKLRGGSRLIGGSRGHGGLFLSDDWHAGLRSGYVAFRLRVVFPTS